MRDSSPVHSVQHLVGTLFRRIARVSGKAVKGFNVSSVQANILIALWVQGPMTMGQLQELLALGSSTLTGAVDRMENAGLVSRQEVPGDRRAWRLVPVSWPAKKQRALMEAIAENEETALSQLSADERTELVRLLEKANASLAARERRQLMRQETQIAVLERLLTAVETRGMAGDGEQRVPVSNYTSAERHAAEREQLFRKASLVVGHVSEVALPGDFLTHDASGVPLLVTRAADGELRAFLNVCRHRGTRLVDALRGTKKRFACPYHAWTYDNTGRCTHIPMAEAFPATHCDDVSLVRLPLETHAGFLFVTPTPGEPGGIARELGPFTDNLAAFGLAEHHVHRRVVEERACNWKLVIDAFLEGYHVKTLHHDTIARFFLDAMVLDAQPPHLRMVGARRNVSELRARPPDTWSVRETGTVFYLLFPNTVLVFHPDWVSVLSMFPRTPERSVYTHTMLVPRAPRDDAERAHWDQTWGLIEGNVFQRQDLRVAENIQSALSARADDAFRLGRLEHAIHLFHESIDRALAK